MNHTNAPAVAAKTAAPAAADATTFAALPAAAPAVEGAVATGAIDLPAADGAAQMPVQPALPFAQWLGLEQLAPSAADGVDTAGAEGTAPGIAPGVEIDIETVVEERQAHADAPVLGAMSMPLMPITQAALAAAVAALPVAAVTKNATPAVDAQAAASPEAPAAGRADAPVPAAIGPRAPAPTPVSMAAAASPALPAEPPAARGDAPQESIVPGVERGAANTVSIATPAAGNAQRTGDSVTLSGPPTAWRQTLQEALGDRLQLQLGKSAEQAVIRLEPPMLGRIEIAIRHSAGSLEVHISATHGEVLRQLQAVGENLRNDLAQRQFTDVAVNIAAAPRAAAAGNANLFAGDGGGRGRQQDGAPDEQQPGNALAEANTGSLPFSLNGTGKRRA